MDRPAGDDAAQPWISKPPQSPCADSLYQALREREYEYFKQREKACTEFQQLSAIVDRTARGEPPPAARVLRSETRSQENSMRGVDIFVRNTSAEPIIVNSVRVTECENLRMGSCGMHYPKTVIPPGQERRVITIRYASDDRRSGYRYTYHIGFVEPR